MLNGFGNLNLKHPNTICSIFHSFAKEKDRQRGRDGKRKENDVSVCV